jgi:hypothetical protein
MTANVDQGFEVSASTEFNASFAAWKAFDDDENTEWACNGESTNAWIQVKFPTANKNLKYVYLLGRVSSPTEVPATVRFQYSTDGISFTDITVGGQTDFNFERLPVVTAGGQTTKRS